MSFTKINNLKGELKKENVYVLVTYKALKNALESTGLIKVGDILEKIRDQKYYQMIKNDAAFWQMKAEQTGMNIADWILEKDLDKMSDKVEEIETDDSDWPKEADVKFEKELEELDEWLPF